MSPRPIRLPDALRQIPPLPQALQRAIQLTRDPDSRRSELAAVLALDQALTGYFLRMVNSAYYGLPHRVGTLDEAISYLGLETVQKVVLGLAAQGSLSRAVPAYLMGPHDLWRHSVAVAGAAEHIARRRGLTSVSETYVAGLFHDVGKLVLDLLLNGEPAWQAALAEDPEVDRMEVESRLLGYHHADLGAAVLDCWNLPDWLVEAVTWHHFPSRARTAPRLAAAVHIANVAALRAGIGPGVNGAPPTVDEAAARILAWTEADMAQLVDAIPTEVGAAERLLGLRPEIAPK